MNENKKSGLVEKYSTQAVQAVASQSGKSLFERMTPIEFSEFLWTIMRYKNMELFSRLATILRSDIKLIEQFWQDIFDNKNPVKILKDTLRVLLITEPKLWDLDYFEDYLDKRTDKELLKTPFANKEYGAPRISAYLIHANTKFFSESLRFADISAFDWKNIVYDWKEVARSTRSKNHYLRNHILRQIVDAGAMLLLTAIMKLHEMKKEFEFPNIGLKEKDPELYEICNDVYSIIWTEFSSLFSEEGDYHSFSSEEHLYLLHRYLSYFVFLFKSEKTWCDGLGTTLFDQGLWKKINPKAQEMPSVMNDMARIWIKTARERTYNEIIDL